jgi:hypothetical protein
VEIGLVLLGLMLPSLVFHDWVIPGSQGLGDGGRWRAGAGDAASKEC